jgi:hypothetical protein
MRPPPRWPWTAVRYLAPILLILLVAQYLLGLWTNLYAPAAGFTSNSSSPSLDWHYNLGFALGILGIVVIAVAGVSRDLWMIGLAVLVFLGVLLAGIAGGDFVGSTPNPPSASILMGAMFLLAFVAALALGFRVWMGPMSPPKPSGVPTPA